MAINELLTRIALKYDTYENWSKKDIPEQGANLILLPGEIGLCAVSSINEGDDKITNPPTILFKVGDGITPFSRLKWASATAADVYSWAKAETVEVDSTTKKLIFKTGNDIKLELDLSSLTIELAARIAALEAANDSTSTNNEIIEQLSTLGSKLEIIQGTGEGSIAKALSDAKDYTDDAIEPLSESIKSLTSQMAQEKTEREDSDNALIERLDAIENFFNGADFDGTNGGLADALDSLLEIQNYLSSEGSATESLLATLDSHGKDIESLQKIVNSTDGTLTLRVQSNEANIASLETNILSLQKITEGFSEDVPIKTTFENLQQQITNVQQQSNNTSEVVTNISNIVNDPNVGLAKTYELTISNTSDIAAIKEDYLTSKDEFILSCGSSTAAVFNIPSE